MDELEQLKEHILSTDSVEQLHALVASLLAELPYEWLNKEEPWLAIAYQINQFGNSDLASIFELANRHCFRLEMELS